MRFSATNHRLQPRFAVYANLEVARTLSPVPGSDHDRRETKLLTGIGITF
jgi:hypothetical protein